jgi:hypothetical protein
MPIITVIKEDKMGGACSMHGTDEICINNFNRKFEGTRPLGRHRRRWENNIKIDIK